ncbi:hypothetical protein FE634_12425 [Nocardioides dongxiaopingii]|uniref:hypothetical protein n=1 Tax=Nocardioides sp. S-1144 TaxID=2582905 RepID=UPI00110DBF97|nr:hypothetical protein [Nocardioides sp. S-1144]QCW51002.1 hypothetical protein FE634_12425 [Nocardioides sp. S-1144]
MTSSESSKPPATAKAATSKVAGAWLKPICGLLAVVTVCGTGIYLVEKTGGADMIKAMGPALLAVTAIAK